MEHGRVEYRFSEEEIKRIGELHKNYNYLNLSWSDIKRYIKEYIENKISEEELHSNMNHYAHRELSDDEFQKKYIKEFTGGTIEDLRNKRDNFLERANAVENSEETKEVKNSEDPKDDFDPTCDWKLYSPTGERIQVWASHDGSYIPLKMV